MRRLLTHAGLTAALLCGLALAALLFHPVGEPDSAGSRIVGHDFSEMYSGAWVNHFAVRSMTRDHRFPTQVDGVVFEEGSKVYVQSLATALLSLPSYLAWDSAGGFNAAMVLNFLLAFWASLLLFRQVGGETWAAFPGALAFALSPFLLDHFAYGPIEGTAVGWIPLALWSVERYSGRRAWHLALQGVLVAATFAANPYYGLFTFAAAAYLMLSREETAARLRLRHAAVVLVVAAVLVSPLAWAMRLAVQHPRSMTPDRAGRAESEFHAEFLRREGVRDVASLALPTRAFHSRFLVHGVYLGLPLLLVCGLAAARVRRSRRWLWMGLAALLFCLGGSLKIGGWMPELGGGPVPLPARFLCLYLPPFTAITHPFRALPLVLLAMGAMAALLFRGATPRKRALLALLCVAIVVDFLVAYRGAAALPSAPFSVPTYYAELARQPGRFGVLDIPVTRSNFIVGRYMLYQLRHGKRIPYNFNHRRFGARDPDAAQAFAQSLALTPQDYNDPRDWAREASRFRCRVHCDGARELAKLGYRYVVQHLTASPAFDGKLAACARRCLPPPVHRDSRVQVYELTRRGP